MNVPAKLTAPDLDSALLMIRDFAVRERVSPDELLDMFRHAIVARSLDRLVTGLPYPVGSLAGGL